MFEYLIIYEIYYQIPIYFFDSEPAKSELGLASAPYSNESKGSYIAPSNALPPPYPPKPTLAEEKISKIAQKVLDDLDKYPFGEWKQFIADGEETFNHSVLPYILIYTPRGQSLVFEPESYRVKGVNLKEIDIMAITNKIQNQKAEIAAKQREKECVKTLEKMGFRLEEVKEELAYI